MDALDLAVTEAERRTRAELVVVVSPISDGYENFFILHGLFVGSLLGFGLWTVHAVVAFPYLLALQFAAIALFLFLPPLRSLCMLFVPERVRKLRVAQRAYDESYLVSRQAAVDTPFVLFYVSLAEHQALFLPNPLVGATIPDEKWNELVAGLASSVRAEGLKNACLKTIRAAADVLEAHFPDDGRPTTPIPNVINGGSPRK